MTGTRRPLLRLDPERLTPEVSDAQHLFEYAPGPTLSPTEWADPYDPAYRVYRIAPGDTPEGTPDDDAWPAGGGAPGGNAQAEPSTRPVHEPSASER